MFNRLSYVKLVGRITAVGPLSITSPAPKSGSPLTTARTDMFPTMPVRVGDVMQRIPVIPATSIRGPFRRSAVADVIEGLGPRADGSIGMSRDDYQFNAIGGIKGTAKDAGGRDIHLARDIIENNIIAAVFGSGEIFTEGLLAVKEARLEGSFSLIEVTDYRTSVRRDDLVRDPELLARFGAEDIAQQAAYVEDSKEVAAFRKQVRELHKLITPLKRRSDLDPQETARLEDLKAQLVTAQKGAKGIQDDPNSAFKEQANTIYGYASVAAGSTFAHSFRLDDPNHLQFGLFLAAARRFSRDCTIGGKVNVGAGEVGMEYEIFRHDGVREDELGNPVEERVGHLSIAQDKTVLESEDAFVLDSVRIYKEARQAGFPGLDFSLPKRDPAKAAAKASTGAEGDSDEGVDEAMETA